MSGWATDPRVRAALARAGLDPVPTDLVRRLDSAFEHHEISPGNLLELSRGDWGNAEQSADDVLVVQTREAMFIILEAPGGGGRGLFNRKPDFVRVRFLYEWYRGVVRDDELAGASVFFVALPGHHDFLINFPTPAERDRMLFCIHEAHAGLFDRWSA